ncbi:hypothetical protein NCAS_0F00170 [Naumovozyma castellii]|uniref:Uncharacterized protein n=1 Tax=Naumovozyma castellii TaxID=27288 RepID=G0VG81_NAUCA|nr:hypothetical protein NCAS_0F00170 [Naumovozyma castellii CBS 4309]CCC70501.1 hypothetical protein NCAS_0F00170 [Naumovozyma castellii CBS 4309]
MSTPINNTAASGSTKKRNNFRNRRRNNKESELSTDGARNDTRNSLGKSNASAQRRPNDSRRRNGKDSKVTVYVNPNELDQANLKVRQAQIDQCITMLGSDSFKLFKKGKNSTSYGFMLRNRKILGVANLKFIITVPLNYPLSPIKLSRQEQTKEDIVQISDQLNILVNNFNNKSKGFIQNDKTPILSQINFFIQDADLLSQKNYKKLDLLKGQFYSQFEKLAS